MTDPVLKPLDPIYARNAPLCEKDARRKRAKYERDLKYNAERRKRIAKCWNCGRFPKDCPDPANCWKEKGNERDGH